MRLAAYLRSSSERRTDSEPSLADQERAIRAWAKRNGHRITGLYSDAGISGANGIVDREGLPLALDEVKAGRADGLVVYRLERLARDMMIQEAIFGDVWSSHGQVFSTMASEDRECQPNDPEDPTRKFLRRFLGLLAEYNRDLTVARLRAGKRAARARGRYLGGDAPFGWQVDNGQLVPDLREQQILEAIRKLRRATPGISLRELGRELDAAGLAPKRGGRWSAESLRRVLQRLPESPVERAERERRERQLLEEILGS